MSDELTTPVVLLGVVLAALAVVVLVVGLLVLRRQHRTAAALARAEADAADLRAEVETVRREAAEREARVAATATAPTDDGPATTRRAPAPPSYVITRLGAGDPAGDGAEDEAAIAPRRTVEVAGRVDGKLFADLLLRETLVRVGAVAHGVRRAVAPETRNRIRFEMRREVKRSRKARRAELRQARRDLHARQRAQGVGGNGAGDLQEGAA